MDPLIVILLGIVLVAMLIILPFGLVWLAFFIYVWTHAYPWLKMVGKFAARPVNLFSLLILYLLLWVELGALLAWLISQLDSPNLLTIFLLLFVLALILIVFVVFILVWLGFVVWIVRLIKWLFVRWRGWIEGIYFSARLQILRQRIKADMRQENARRVKPTTGLKMGKK